MTCEVRSFMPSALILLMSASLMFSFAARTGMASRIASASNAHRCFRLIASSPERTTGKGRGPRRGHAAGVLTTLRRTAGSRFYHGEAQVATARADHTFVDRATSV